MNADHPMPDKVGRFTVIDNDDEFFKLMFFDKSLQSDFVATMFISIGPGAVAILGAAIVAWQLSGVVVPAELVQ
jgi:hypothetical protein